MHPGTTAQCTNSPQVCGEFNLWKFYPTQQCRQREIRLFLLRRKMLLNPNSTSDICARPILTLLTIKHTVVSEKYSQFSSKTGNAGLDDEGSVFFCNWTQKVTGSNMRLWKPVPGAWCLVPGTMVPRFNMRLLKQINSQLDPKSESNILVTDFENLVNVDKMWDC